MTTRIFLLSISHNRSFNTNKLILPIFLGPGSHINLFNIDNINNSINKF